MQVSIEDLIHKLGLNDTMVLQKAAERLKNLAWSHTNNQVKIADAGAIPALVALLGPQSSSGVLKQTARALCSLAYNNDKNKVKNRYAGGVDALTRLMQSTTEKRRSKKWARCARQDVLGR